MLKEQLGDVGVAVLRGEVQRRAAEARRLAVYRVAVLQQQAHALEAAGLHRVVQRRLQHEHGEQRGVGVEARRAAARRVVLQQHAHGLGVAEARREVQRHARHEVRGGGGGGGGAAAVDGRGVAGLQHGLAALAAARAAAEVAAGARRQRLGRRQRRGGGGDRRRRRSRGRRRLELCSRDAAVERRHVAVADDGRVDVLAREQRCYNVVEPADEANAAA